MKSAALALAPLGLLVLDLLLVAASPIRYDQRQEGDQNVDARLQNFFVVLSPSNTGQLGSGINLLDLASKAVPLRLRPQAAQDGLKQREEPEGQQQEVKEVKSGRSVVQPSMNAVAIPAAILQSPLAKLHPEVQAISVEEVLIARSPVVELRSPPAPVPAAAAVPMLVAVPVPEVAPERPAAPPALLPMHPAGTRPLGDKQDAAAAAPETPAAAPAETPAAETPAADAVRSPVAVAVVEDVVEDAVVPVLLPASSDAVDSSQQAEIPAASIEALPASVETNQIEPDTAKLELQSPAELSKVHLIGTGIEECGPERVRNNEGICVVEAPQAPIETN